MDGFVEEAFASALCSFSIARVLFDVRNHACIENALAIVCGIKSGVEIDIGAFEVQTDLFGYLLQRFQTFRQR